MSLTTQIKNQEPLDSEQTNQNQNKVNTNVSLEFRSPQYKAQTNSTFHASFDDLNLASNLSNSPQKIPSLHQFRISKKEKSNSYLNNSQDYEGDEIMEEDSDNNTNKKRKSEIIERRESLNKQNCVFNLEQLMNSKNQESTKQSENSDIIYQFPQMRKQKKQKSDSYVQENLGSLDQIEGDFNSINNDDDNINNNSNINNLQIFNFKQNKINKNRHQMIIDNLQNSNCSSDNQNCSSGNMTPSRIIQERKKTEVPRQQQQEIASTSPRRQTLPEFNMKEKEPCYSNVDYANMYKIYTGDQIMESDQQNNKKSDNIYDDMYGQLDDGICEDGFDEQDDGIVENYNYDHNLQSDGIIEDGINEGSNMDLSDGIQEDCIDENDQGNSIKNASMQSIYDENGQCNFESGHNIFNSNQSISTHFKKPYSSRNSVCYSGKNIPQVKPFQSRKSSKQLTNLSLKNRNPRKSIRKLVHFQEEDDIPNYSNEHLFKSMNSLYFQQQQQQQQQLQQQQQQQQNLFPNLNHQQLKILSFSNRNSPSFKPQNHKKSENILTSMYSNLDLNDNNSNNSNNSRNSNYSNSNINSLANNDDDSSSSDDTDSPTIQGSRFKEDRYLFDKQLNENNQKYNHVNSCNNFSFKI